MQFNLIQPLIGKGSNYYELTKERVSDTHFLTVVVTQELFPEIAYRGTKVTLGNIVVMTIEQAIAEFLSDENVNDFLLFSNAFYKSGLKGAISIATKNFPEDLPKRSSKKRCYTVKCVYIHGELSIHANSVKDSQQMAFILTTMVFALLEKVEMDAATKLVIFNNIMRLGDLYNGSN